MFVEVKLIDLNGAADATIKAIPNCKPICMADVTVNGIMIHGVRVFRDALNHVRISFPVNSSGYDIVTVDQETYDRIAAECVIALAESDGHPVLG